MPMMFIMNVSMAVLEELMLVPVFVPLAEMEPESPCHQRRRSKKLPGRFLPVQDQSQRRSDERRH